MWRVILTGWIVALSFSIRCSAQITPVDVKSDLPSLLSYLNATAPDPETIARLSDLIIEVENESNTDEARKDYFKHLIDLFSSWLGHDTVGLGKIIEFRANQIIRDDLPVFERLTYEVTPPLKVGEVVKVGTGKTPVILIPEYRKNWRVYEPLMALANEEYTWHAITFPGYNDTSPYPLPEKFDFSKRVWLNNLADAVIALIEKESLEKCILIGAVDGGTYVAVQVAAQLPDRIKDVMILNGKIYGPKKNEINEFSKSTYADLLWHIFPRKKLSDEEINVRLSRKLTPNHPINYYTRDTIQARTVMKMHLTFPSITERYDLEWETCNLEPVLTQLKVPVLVLCSVYDEQWPFSTNKSTIQWKEFLSKNPDLPIRLKEVKDTRMLISLDNPEAILSAMAGLQTERVKK
jgi:pimeloyl-ACP methyl ester carboxylesterase